MSRMGAGGSEPQSPNDPIIDPELTDAASKQALQQVMMTIRNRENPDRQQQILSILLSNPQIVPALKKKQAVIVTN